VFIKAQKLILGISSGFHIMGKMGVLPEPDFKQRITLAVNDSGSFESRWVFLKNNKNSPCIFTKGIDYLLVPVRHNEGKVIPKDEDVLNELRQKNQVVFQYVDDKGNVAGYPWNPSNSIEGIAGICDKGGRIFGMMPHPEGFNIVENCPYWVKGTLKEPLGLRIFRNAVEYTKQSGI
jgi:phosphoribosylformylglycinamidine synthase